MYGPVPFRQKKTNITRSRGGCETCKKKRRKCDKAKPQCERCRQVGVICKYPDVAFHFRDARGWAESKVRKVRGDRLASLQYENVDSENASIDSAMEHRPLTLPLSSMTLGGNADMASWSNAHDPTDSAYAVNYTAASKTYHSHHHVITDTESCSLPGYCFCVPFRNPIPGLGPDPSGTPTPVRVLSPLQLRLFDRSWHDLPKELGTCTSLSTPERFHLWHFENEILTRMPSYLEVIKHVATGSEAMISALMALAAADLAMRQGRYAYELAPQKYVMWRRNRKHNLAALQYIERSLSLISAPSQLQLSVLITTHLILAFVEITLGTYIGLRGYISNIDELVSRNMHELNSSEENQRILRGIVNSQVTIRTLAGPWQCQAETDLMWRTLKARLCMPLVMLQDMGMQAALTAQQLTMSSYLLQSLRGHYQIPECVLAAARILLPPSIFWDHTDLLSESQLEKILESKKDELKSLKSRIDAFPSAYGPGRAHWTIPRLEVSQITVPGAPLQTPKVTFQSHEQAMEAAYYSFCQIMCDVELSLQQVMFAPHKIPAEHGHQNPWLELLLSTADILIAKEALRSDFYRRGISWLIFECAHRCNSILAYDMLTQHLELIKQGHMAWDDVLFPVEGWIRLLPFFRRAVECGKRILAVDHPTTQFSEHNSILRNVIPTDMTEHGIDADGRPYAEQIILH